MKQGFFDRLTLKLRMTGKMKKSILLLLCSLFLMGCSNRNSSSSGWISVSETTEQTFSDIILVPPDTESEIKGKTICKRIPTGVEITLDSLTYLIEFENTADIQQIIVKDYDFDGTDDIFIGFEKYLQQGVYYRLDKEKQVFTEWNYLNEISKYSLVQIEDNNTISQSITNYDGSMTIYYKWLEGVLVPTRFTDYYFGDCDILDDYRYDENGEKILFQRKYINDDNIVIKTVESPLYFHVNETSVDVLKDGEVIQSIPDTGLYRLVDRLKEYSKTVIMEGGVREPEKYLRECDYNFDGYADLGIPQSMIGPDGEESCKYYRYDPEIEKYVPWREMNQIGKLLYTDCNTETIRSYTVGKDTDVYKWIEGILVLVQREKWIYEDNFHVKYHIDVYEVDENGKETLIETKYHE